MGAINLGNLLAMQECDTKRLALEQQLQSVPREIAGVETKIAAERTAIETAKAEWHGVEAQKKSLENDIKSSEEKAAKYRTQQLEVRKNDEYRALTHEIELMEAAVSGFEEAELKVMYEIDEAKKRFALAEAELKANITGYETKIKTLRTRESQLQADHQVAAAAVTTARALVPEDQLKVYDRIARKPGHPVCVPVHAGRCGGCHMKVSSNVEFEARKGDELATCDQCTRIVVWER